MSSLKFIMWNGSGIRPSCQTTKQKLDFIAKELDNSNFAVAAFVETHLKQDDDLPTQIKIYSTNYQIINEPTSQNETHAGILILIHEDIRITQTSVIQPGRIISCHIEHKVLNIALKLIIVYGCQNSKMNKQDIDSFCATVQDSCNPEEPTLVLGDFNFVTCQKDRKNQIGSHERLFNSPWATVLSESRLSDAYRSQYPNKITYSYISKLAKSRLDRAYVSEDFANKIVRQRYTRTPFPTAHKIYSFEIIGEQEIGPPYWKFNTSFLKDAQYTRLVQKTVYNMDNVPNLDAKSWWRIFLKCIKSKTVEYGIDKKRVEKSLKQEITKEIDQLEKDEDSTPEKDERWRYLYQKLKDMEFKEIESYKTRIKGLPTYEQKEPDIQFYAELEKSRKQKSLIPSLLDKDGLEHSDKNSLLQIVKAFYSTLYSPSKVNSTTQTKLLRNIKKKISAAHKVILDAPITKEEIRKAVKAMNINKSPGLDGIPAEFYQTYWHILEPKYFAYLSQIQKEGLDPFKNKSVTTILYKNKGNRNNLQYYRPIALINVDVKIITKILTNRLKPILPTIIHKTQTAIDSRKINHTVHMIRDLIDYTNEKNLGACFLFLDQEKAFDRVDHDFLFKVMETFGIGEKYINWLRMIYSNATMTVKVNGFLTDEIPIQRGVRQGDPLSFYLYIFVNEILSLQLRANQNIVGFKVGGEKIISMHYADDTTIAILQNKCFKEVYKEIELYEEATGAKVNFEKTTGLWLGSWKNRTDEPIPITFTNKNVKTLGVYYGNQDPARETYTAISKKIRQSIGYWQRFKLNKFSKARVLEIFHASRLWYAANFYPIPTDILRQITEDFWTYINYPSKKITVSKDEATKLREDGGLKLVDIQIKSTASKVKWLMEVVSDPSLKTNLDLITILLGIQKFDIKGKDLFFVPTPYVDHRLKTSSSFYKEAIRAFSLLETRKKIKEPTTEHLFYNKSILVQDTGKVLQLHHNEHIKTTKLAPILEANEFRKKRLPFIRRYTNLYDKLDLRLLTNKTDDLIIINEKPHPFTTVTQKLLYATLLKLKPLYKDSHYVRKWNEEFQTTLNWQEIWRTVHCKTLFESTKSSIWEQIHLNFFTQYNFNKWHSMNSPCSFCRKIPRSPFHIILKCSFINLLWHDLHPFIRRIYNTPVTKREMAFGLTGVSQPVRLRNWITFTLREMIEKQEKNAYYKPGLFHHLQEFKVKFNQRIKKLVHRTALLQEASGDTDTFLTLFAYNKVLVSVDENDEIKVNDPYSND